MVFSKQWKEAASLILTVGRPAALSAPAAKVGLAVSSARVRGVPHPRHMGAGEKLPE